MANVKLTLLLVSADVLAHLLVVVKLQNAAEPTNAQVAKNAVVCSAKTAVPNALAKTNVQVVASAQDVKSVQVAKNAVACSETNAELNAQAQKNALVAKPLLKKQLKKKQLKKPLHLLQQQVQALPLQFDTTLLASVDNLD
ncbi:MAG: hypothetical protein COA78_28050 [Blastopirellula sp.]|nr:MAG: hypothetical protein COA78_28050 [Blastopirellula sp.]